MSTSIMENNFQQYGTIFYQYLAQFIEVLKIPIISLDIVILYNLKNSLRIYEFENQIINNHPGFTP